MNIHRQTGLVSCLGCTFTWFPMDKSGIGNQQAQIVNNYPPSSLTDMNLVNLTIWAGGPFKPSRHSRTLHDQMLSLRRHRLFYFVSALKLHDSSLDRFITDHVCYMMEAHGPSEDVVTLPGPFTLLLLRRCPGSCATERVTGGCFDLPTG